MATEPWIQDAMHSIATDYLVELTPDEVVEGLRRSLNIIRFELLLRNIQLPVIDDDHVVAILRCCVGLDDPGKIIQRRTAFGTIALSHVDFKK